MTVLEMSLSATILILAIVIIRAIALHKLPKKTFLVLWGVALCRLLVPFSIPSRFSIYTIADMLKNKTLTIDTPHIVTAMPDIVTVAGRVNSTSLADTATATVTVSPIMVVWLIGLSICALFFLVTHLRCRKEYKTALPIENEFVKVWQQEHPTRRKVEIRQSDKIAAPLTYGVLRPVVLLPKTTDWTNETRLRYILTHEFVHIRRFDTLIKLLLAAALCVHWFNPLVWVMYILFNRDIELSCDETVVRAFGETMKSAYALTLIGLEEKKSRLTPLVNNFSKNAIEERINAIMKMKKTSLMGIFLALALVIGTVTVFATNAASAPPSDDGKNAEKENAALIPSATTIPTERITKKEAEVPAEPVSEDALPKYWAMGALNVDGIPYLPLVQTAEDLGYTINVSSFKIADEVPNWNPQYPDAVEYNYELSKDGKSVGLASLDISDGIVISSMIDQIFCNTHDKSIRNSFVLQHDTVYMPAQFFKEALDTDNKLP